MICVFCRKLCPRALVDCYRNMSWVVTIHTNNESKLSQRVLKETAEKENTGSNQDSSFLDQFNSSENGRNYCQNSNSWNWFFNRKITFVFNSAFVQCFVLIKSSHKRWRKFRKRHKTGLFTTHMEWNTQIFEQLLMSKGQGLMAKNKEFVTNFCIVPY